MMTSINETELWNYVDIANDLIQKKTKESPLRHQLSVHLLLIFEDKPYWIKEWASKSESNAKFDEDDIEHRGSVDNIVGETAIEVEKNLQIESVFEVGYHQVEQYCASLLNEGCEPEDVLGVLTDTVRWYGYRVAVTSQPKEGHLYGPNNLDLILESEVDLTLKDHQTALRFSNFVSTFIDRDGSYNLSPDRIRSDFGFYSETYSNNITQIRNIVHDFFKSESNSSKIVKRLWTQFVDYLGGSTYSFDEHSYSDELYLSIVVKILCANILERKPLISSEPELFGIIDGTFFKNLGIVNFVEYDYFGWTTLKPFTHHFIEVYKTIQKTMIGYDFNSIHVKDLLGPVLSNLVRNDHRILLGQEFTPTWLADRITKRVMESLEPGVAPRFLDMCCGTGVFLITILQNTIKRMELSSESATEEEAKSLIYSATGFDIDPLSVLMAKTNWIACTRDFIKPIRSNIIIPIYHADSLFSRTIISENLKHDYATRKIEMNLDDEFISIPGILVTNELQPLFDDLMERCHSYSSELASLGSSQPKTNSVKKLVEKSIQETVGIYPSDIDELISDMFKLIQTFSKLQIEGRNGIWSFVIENSYRPGLVNGCFNGIVSNPPWLSLSKIGNNPLGSKIREYFTYYDIMPSSESAPHLEVSTVFVLSSVDRYLSPGSMIGCLLPCSILNGKHLDPFRNGRYSRIPNPVLLEPVEIWDVDKDCFKSKSVSFFATKNKAIDKNSIPGILDFSEQGGKECQYYIVTLQDRTIWSLKQLNSTAADKLYAPKQGADVMDRVLFFYDCNKQPNGKWTIKSMTQGSPNMKYISKDVKNWHDYNVYIMNFEDEFIFNCYLSKMLLPFIVCEPAKVALPAINDGTWKPLSQADIDVAPLSMKGFLKAICVPESGFKNAEDIFNKLNTRNKLTEQQFDNISWIVLIGAGGSKPCAAYLKLDKNSCKKIIVDQTLYWISVESEDEASYITGMINSKSMSETIDSFQTEGKMGKRHVHTAYLSFLPKYDSSNELHSKISSLTKQLCHYLAVKTTKEDNDILDPNSSNLQVRRKRVMSLLTKCEQYEEYESVCDTLIKCDRTQH